MVIVSDDRSSGHTAMIAPYPINAKRTYLVKNKESKNTATKQITPPSRRRGSTQTGFRIHLPERVGSIAAWAVLYLYSVYRGDVDTDNIASRTPKGTRKEAES